MRDWSRFDPSLDTPNRTALERDWNRTSTELGESRGVHEAFAEFAQRSPTAPALRGDWGVMTYGELNRAANRIAADLLAAGLEEEEPVAVWNERTPGMVATLLGILKAGGAYLPLDPDHGVTSAWLTSGLFRAVADECPEALAPLRQLLVGGDVVPPDLAAALLDRFPRLHLVNGYGPTENTTFSCCHRVTREDCRQSRIPIGRPISNSTAHILDPRGQLCEIRTEGEIFVGGAGLARGYRNDAQATAQNFPVHPVWGRLYATGDCGVRRANGDIEFLGRRDHQIKVRGFRIEPAEVEAAIMKFPRVRQAVVLGVPAPSGDKMLVAGVVPSDIPPDTLRGELAKSLPAPFIPSTIFPLEKIPLTENGKVDRKALTRLLKPSEARVAAGLPIDRDEEAVASIWRELLGRAHVGPEDSFFELGGDSLLAARVHARLAVLAGRPLAIADFFAHPTPRAQARWVRGEAGKGGNEDARQRAALRRGAFASASRRQRPTS